MAKKYYAKRVSMKTDEETGSASVGLGTPAVGGGFDAPLDYKKKKTIIARRATPTVEAKSFATLKPKPNKNKWVEIDNKDLQEPDSELNVNLYDMIDKSYSKIGGHKDYNSPKDVPYGKDGNDYNVIWWAIDTDQDPEADAVKWVREVEPHGFKSLGGASDGGPEAKQAYLDISAEQLNTPGYYGEASDAIAHVLITRYKVPFVNDKERVETVLGKKVEWVGENPNGKYPGYNGWYNRMLGGKIHMKIMLGTPK